MNVPSFFLSSFFLGMFAATSAAAAEPTKRECVSANESAQDLRRAGKLREARASFAVCTAESCPSVIRDDCAQRLKEVEAALPSLVFEVKDHAGQDLSAVRVTMDGEVLRDKLDGAATAVDPGEHRFTFEADGMRKIEEAVVVREGDRNRPVRVVLESTAVALAPVEKDTSVVDAGTRRTIGLAVGATGVAAVVVGGIFGVLAKLTYENAKTECGGNIGNCSLSAPPQAHQHWQAAYTQATVSTIAFIGGGVLLAGGAALYFTALKTGDVAIGPRVTGQDASLVLKGAW